MMWDMRWPRWTESLARIQGLYLHTLLKFLFISALFSIATFAKGYQNVYQTKKYLDPKVLTLEGVEASQIGSCIQGTNRDPFEATGSFNNSSGVELCLVYWVRDKAKISWVRSQYQNLNVESVVAVRFQ